MRTLVFFVSVFWIGVTYGYPSVGDKVEWRGTVQNSQNEPLNVVITKEVLSFNDSSSRWTVQYKLSLGDQSLTKTLSVDTLYTPEQSKKILSECISQGGQIENIDTTIGSFKTCKLATTTEEGTIIEKWWGDIPFGVVSKSTRSLNTSQITPSNIESLLGGL